MSYLNRDFSEHFEEKSLQKIEKIAKKFFVPCVDQFRDFSKGFEKILMILIFFSLTNLQNCTPPSQQEILNPPLKIIGIFRIFTPPLMNLAGKAFGGQFLKHNCIRFVNIIIF